jgi:hypothetical protein
VIVVVMPSRGRPDRAREAVQAIRDTAVRVSTNVIVAVDADDPTAPQYGLTLANGRDYAADVTLVSLNTDETGDLVKATNTVSRRVARENPDAIIGNLGDDHICRTLGWDRMVEDALATPGIAYGNDLIHGEHLPSAPFISARIVNALGWYFLPTVQHLYGDDAVRELGKAAGVLRYLPDMVIEHMHPAVGKAEWDDGYRKANGTPTVNHDKSAYHAWLLRHLPKDAAKVRAVAA